jgi:hypothetical protein
MTAELMPEPDGPRDERFVYVVTAAGVEALRESAAAFDSEREASAGIGERRLDCRRGPPTR